MAEKRLGEGDGPPLLRLARDAVKLYKRGTSTASTQEKMKELGAMIDRIDNARAALRRFEDGIYGGEGCSGPDSGPELPSVP